MAPESPHRRRALLLLLLAPGLLGLLVFFVTPLARMATLSFYQYSPTQFWVPDFVLDNYLRFFSRYYYLRVAGTTLYIASFVTILCVILGYPFAYFLARAAEHRLGPYYFILISPMILSSVVLVFGWVSILGPQGPVADLLRTLGLPAVKLLYNKGAIVLGLTQLLLPFMVFPLMSAIENIHLTIEEAAQNLGASKRAVFFRVILPLSKPGLISGSLLVFSMALGSMVAPALLGGPADSMLGSVIYDSVMNTLNWPFAAATSLILLGATVLLMTLYLQTVRRTGAARRGMDGR
jgi:putative spermidine/putrescine transport system permease protein